MLTIATAQSHIEPDVRSNGRHIRAMMEQASRAGARLVHFPEGALSGYAGDQVEDWIGVDWPALRAELDATAAAARRLGLWVVLGSNHVLPSPYWPQNCLFVISDAGIVVGRYAKRMCSNTEVTYWYTPGTQPLTFEVEGVRFGCALCIEVVFPALFAEYAGLGVQCMLLSSYSQDPVHGVMARAHAGTTCMWLSLSTPVACSAGLPSTLFGPDGNPIQMAPAGRPGLLLQAIDPDDPRYHVALRLARPWRARALSGQIYADRAMRTGM